MKNCGTLNKLVSFARQIDKDDFDDFQKTGKELQIIRTVRASVRPVTGNESYEQDRLFNTVSYDIRTRYIPELEDPNLVIIFRNERYEIRSAVNIGGKNTELAFTCLKVNKNVGQYT